jgi:hypothetical protein
MLEHYLRSSDSITEHLYKHATVNKVKHIGQQHAVVSKKRKAAAPSNLETLPALTADDILRGAGTQFPEVNGEYPQEIE